MIAHGGKDPSAAAAAAAAVAPRPPREVIIPMTADNSSSGAEGSRR